MPKLPYVETPEDDDDSCWQCGGEGYCEVDDPVNDDCDEFGYGECPACGGTGIEGGLPSLQ